MPLQRGEVLGYDFNRMVVDFTMLNQGKMVKRAISTAAMDDLEGKHDVKADQRVDQFVRLRDTIEERASRKFSERPASRVTNNTSPVARLAIALASCRLSVAAPDIFSE